jgi:hypothetical protein
LGFGISDLGFKDGWGLAFEDYPPVSITGSLDHSVTFHKAEKRLRAISQQNESKKNADKTRSLTVTPECISSTTRVAAKVSSESTTLV